MIVALRRAKVYLHVDWSRGLSFGVVVAWGIVSRNLAGVALSLVSGVRRIPLGS